MPPCPQSMVTLVPAQKESRGENYGYDADGRMYADNGMTPGAYSEAGYPLQNADGTRAEVMVDFLTPSAGASIPENEGLLNGILDEVFDFAGSALDDVKSSLSSLFPSISVVEGAPEDLFYSVKEGDTLSHIAQRLLGEGSKESYIALANANNIENADQIRVGQEIRLPGEYYNDNGILTGSGDKFSYANFFIWSGGKTVDQAQQEYSYRTDGKTITVDTIAKLYSDTFESVKLLHTDATLHNDFRNIVNQNVPNSEAEVPGGWLKLPWYQNVFHGVTTTKYLSPDGHREVIYDSNGEYVDNKYLKGSYNFAHPDTEKWGHTKVDVSPAFIPVFR